MSHLTDQQAIEKLEVLDGSRNASRQQAAVRREDLVALLQIQPLKSAKVSSTPTDAEFNALIDDVHGLHARVMEIVTRLQKQLLP